MHLLAPWTRNGFPSNICRALLSYFTQVSAQKSYYQNCSLTYYIRWQSFSCLCLYLLFILFINSWFIYGFIICFLPPECKVIEVRNNISQGSTKEENKQEIICLCLSITRNESGDHGSWLRKFKIHSAGLQEGKIVVSMKHWHRSKLLP